MNPIKAILPVILYVVATVSTGCVATTGTNNNVFPEGKIRYSTQQVLDKLKANTMSQVRVKNGYKMNWKDELYLKVVAGIYAGTVKVNKKGKEIRATGNYSEFMHPEALEQALADADTNNDQLITSNEARNLHTRVINGYAQ